MSHNSTAKAVREHKEQNADLYCPAKSCLWHTDGDYCPRHNHLTITPKGEAFPNFMHGWKEQNINGSK
jgi:hypothetical protein